MKREKFLKSLTFGVLFAVSCCLVACQKNEVLESSRHALSESQKRHVMDIMHNSSGEMTFFPESSKLEAFGKLNAQELDYALEEIAKKIAQEATPYLAEFGFSYDDAYELARLQWKAVTQVALSVFKKPYTQLTEDEFLELVDHHSSRIISEAIANTTSEKIINYLSRLHFSGEYLSGA